MNKDYLLIYGSIAHFSFAFTFLSLLNLKNKYRIFLTTGHFIISYCFLLRFIKDDKSSEKSNELDELDELDENKSGIIPYIGIIGHLIICIFFISRTIIENINYRITSTNILINIMCILGQIGMIIHYVAIKLNKENDDLNTSINFIVTVILCIFYLTIALKQKKKDRILMPPLLMISLLYLGFSLRNILKLFGNGRCLI